MRTATFSPTADDLLDAYRLYYIYYIRRPPMIWTIVLVGLGVSVIAASYLSDGNLSKGLPLLAVFAIGWAVFAAMAISISYYRLARTTRRVYAQQKELHDVIELDWDDAQITIKSHRGSTRFDWSDFLRAQRNDKALLLFQSDALFNFIPKRALTDAQADDIWRSVHGAVK